jgi:hypothetical protein
MSICGPLLLALAVLVWPTSARSTVVRRRAGLARLSRTAVRPRRSCRLVALAGRRRDRLERGLSPDLEMDLVACGLRAGLGVPDALGCAAEAGRTGTAGPAPASYLVGVVSRLRMGAPVDRAWARPPPEYAGLARALMLAELSGAPAAAVVARAAQDARAVRRERVEREAARLGVRLVLPLGLAVLPGFVLLAVVPIVLGLAGSVLDLGR